MKFKTKNIINIIKFIYKSLDFIWKFCLFALSLFVMQSIALIWITFATLFGTGEPLVLEKNIEVTNAIMISMGLVMDVFTFCVIWAFIRFFVIPEIPKSVNKFKKKKLKGKGNGKKKI